MSSLSRRLEIAEQRVAHRLAPYVPPDDEVDEASMGLTIDPGTWEDFLNDLRQMGVDPDATKDKEPAGPA
jgi:hypothetical protein